MKRWGGLKTLERPRVVPEECVLLGGRLDWRGASGEDSRYFIAADTEAVSSLRLVYPFVAWRGPPVLRKGATAWGLRSPKTGSPGRLYVLAEQSRACLNSDAGVGPFPSLFFLWGAISEFRLRPESERQEGDSANLPAAPIYGVPPLRGHLPG